AQGSPSIDTSSVHTVPRPSTPSRMGFFIRQSAPDSPSQRSSGFTPQDPGSPRHGSLSWDEVSELDGNYLEYLQEARVGIDRCTRACRVWSAPYDGDEPSPRSISPPTPEEVTVSPDYFSPPPSSTRSQDREREARRHSSITPRTKKRSLQEEEGGRSARVQDSGHTESSHEGTPVPALMNGAISDEQGYLGGSRGAGHERRADNFEIKKVKREPVEDGKVGGATVEGQMMGAENRAELMAANGGDKQRWASTQWEATDSVDSLIDELLERAPAETNGAHVSIEKLGEELKKMEDSMRVVAVQEAPADGHMAIPSEEELDADDHRETGNTKSRSDSLTLLLNSPLRAQNGGQPYTGPFIAILFAKLENMLTNSLYVNFLLTGIVAQLACHPQPLLRSFLLNTNMVFQPSVKSLVQVLGSVKNKIELFAASQEDFPTLLFKAKKFLIARGKLDWGEGSGSVPALRRSDALVKSRKPSIGELILRHTNSPTRARQAAQMAFQHVRDGQVLHALSGTSIFKSSAEKQNEALRVKNAVYCAVIFTEFMKELAAITQEHAVTSPYLPADTEE
ncbi:hypothetical protein GDO78_016002, partial [Eleutherodactylus coqui]